MTQGSLFDQKFYNTIHLTGSDLVSAKDQTGVQDGRVLELYRELGKMTPLAAWRAYCDRFPACPCTSIRRSINTLTGLGRLRMLPEMAGEQYGKPNHIWEII